MRIRPLSTFVAAALSCVTMVGCRKHDAPRAPEGNSATARRPTPDEQAWPCYAPELASNPQLQGDVQVGFEIAADGQVHAARVLSTTLHDVNVELCVVSLVNGWKLSNPMKAVAESKMTFRFRPRPKP